MVRSTCVSYRRWGSVPSTYMTVYDLVPRDLMPFFSDVCRHETFTRCTYMHVGKILIYIKIVESKYKINTCSTMFRRLLI